MAYAGPRSDQSYADQSGLRAEGREPGTRRKKLAGYLKAANDLRQSYFNADGNREHHSIEDGPGAFPDAAVVRSGNEEMILFPSYARKHVESKYQNAATPGRELSEEEYWQREWDKHEDVNAIVDVDVRGWIYTPPRGQHTRKQRMLIGLARQLSGIPAPSSNRLDDCDSSSNVPSRQPSPMKQQDEDLINLEAQNIIRKGQYEEKVASRGRFSERPSQVNDTESLFGDAGERGRAKSTYASSIVSVDSDSGTMEPVQKKNTWQQPGKMSQTELTTANMHLLTRLKPFMANPLATTPISAFFYNQDKSRQQTVYTDTSGHFSFRAALDFIPTHVRVLAGEKLSATEEVIVTSPKGVSLISDIDDTIKHSAISSGAREIFRNAFIRELGDLTIDGVREWYSTLHDMGVKIHYVSNSPWQMYPALTTYFKLAGLPRGSFHLKQYSGMLQGIFEPAAERKKGSLEKIMRDFPERSFILVGDSGEADLEVYTEVALANPGRILGIFIRDVTTAVQTGYFDSSYSPGGGSGKHSRNGSRNHSRRRSGDSLAASKRLSRPQDIRNDDADIRAAIAASLEDMEEEARRARRSINPDSYSYAQLSSEHAGRLPSRPPARKATSGGTITASPEEDLIDFSDPGPSKALLEPPRRHVTPSMLPSSDSVREPKSASSPPPPPKPAVLRSPPPDGREPLSIAMAQKTPPPRPKKPSTVAIHAIVPQIQAHHPSPHQPSPLSQVQRQDSTKKAPPPLPDRRRAKGGVIAKGLQMTMPGTWQPDPAALARPKPKSVHSYSHSPLARPMSLNRSFDDFTLPDTALNQATSAPAPPPRRQSANPYSTSAVRKATNRLSAPGTAGGDDDPGGGGPSTPEGVTKKEYLWQQRWARAKGVLERNGVTSRTWRVGCDVADVCVKLVEMEMRRVEREERKSSGGGGWSR